MPELNKNGCVKGANFLKQMEFYVSAFGRENVEKVMKALDPEDNKILFFQPIFSSSWIDYGAVTRFGLMADKLLGKGDHALRARSAEYIARANFKGLYRFMILLTSPLYILKKTALVWRLNHDTGLALVTSMSEKSALLKVTSFPNIPLYHEHVHGHYIVELIRMAGGKNPSFQHPQCAARGDENCIFEFSWE